MLNAVHRLLLDLQREFLVNMMRLRVMISTSSSALAIFTALLKCDLIELLECHHPHLLGLCHCCSTHCTRVIDNLERIPKVFGGVLQEVEAGTVSITRVLKPWVAVTLLFPGAVYVELPALVGHRIILFELLIGHNHVPVCPICHKCQLSVKACIIRIHYQCT